MDLFGGNEFKGMSNKKKQVVRMGEFPSHIAKEKGTPTLLFL
jgi:hypothetical protein